MSVVEIDAAVLDWRAASKDSTTPLLTLLGFIDTLLQQRGWTEADAWQLWSLASPDLRPTTLVSGDFHSPETIAALAHYCNAHFEGALRSGFRSL